MESTLMTSIIGIFIFSILMIAAYTYADGKWRVAENKRDKYQNWTEKSGRRLRKSILIICIIYGVFMLIQILSVI